jgi:hypothetical protein
MAAARATARLGVILLLLGLLAGCGAGTPGEPGIPRTLTLEARPIGRGPAFHPPARGPVIGACRRRLGRRYGAHVEVFAENRVVLIAAGIGTRPPRGFSAGRISRAGCYGDLVTVDPTGLVLVRPGARATVGDLFRSWGRRLSARAIGAFAQPPGARVRAFVAGQPWPGAPGAIPLTRHAEIVLEVGPLVPPHVRYTFPLGL